MTLLRRGARRSIFSEIQKSKSGACVTRISTFEKKQSTPGKTRQILSKIGIIGGANLKDPLHSAANGSRPPKKILHN